MAGHSKWSNTKYRKASQDIKKSKIFTKMIRSLIIASKLGGHDPNTNTNLRTVIEKALSYNVPRNIITRAIQKNIKNTKNIELKHIKYGGYGPNNVAIIIECLSNNTNRTVSEIRHILSKFQYLLKPVSTIEYLFKNKINMYYPYDNENIIKSICNKYHVKNIEKNNDIKVVVDTKSCKIIKSELNILGIIPKKMVFSITPLYLIQLTEDEKTIFIDLIKKLKHNLDVKNIYHNAQIIKHHSLQN